MMRMSSAHQNEPHRRPPPINGGAGGGSRVGEKVWELRPGGMLVQKRTDEENRIPPPTIRVRVKFGSAQHEFHISSQATFGELKKMLMGPTGLHHQDQKLFYKDKERDSKSFLDVVGVKDKSKIVLEEDPLSREKRFAEMKRSAKTEKAAKLMSEISLEVAKLGAKVSSIESAISRGEKVVERDVVELIELLMNQLLKLDGMAGGDGDVKLQRKMQVKRVQKYVEALDALKMKSASPSTNYSPARAHGSSSSSSQEPSGNTLSHSLIDDHSVEPSRNTNPFLIATTQWETFDSNPSPAHSMPSNETSSAVRREQPSFNWDLL